MALISCLVVMVCVIYSSTILSLIIFNFPSVLKVSFLFAEIFVYRFSLWNLFINPNKRISRKKLKITREILQIKMIYTTILCIFSIYSLSLVHLRRSLLRTVFL